MKYLIVLFLFGCKAKNIDNGFFHNVYGESISQCTLPLDISTAGLDKKTTESVEYATNEWNSKFGKILFTVSRTSKNLVVNINNWIRPSRQQALTTSRWAGKCIFSVGIEVNTRDFYYYRTGERQSGVNLDALLLHELGHTLGLIDNDNKFSVMHRYLAMQENRVNATDFDLDNLRTVYK